MDEGDMGLDDRFHHIRLECYRLSHPDCNSDDSCSSHSQSSCAKCKDNVCNFRGCQVAMETGVG